MNTIEKKSLKVGEYVNTAHVDNVIRNYKQERWIHNSERIGKEDSLSAWWSIEEMEQFLETAKMHGADGVKFYFGAYANDYAEKPEYAGRQTLAMVATEQQELANGKVANRDVYVEGENGMNILAYNMANICPPYTHGTDEKIGITIVDNGENGMMIV